MNRNKCKCPIGIVENGAFNTTVTFHTVACGQFTGKVQCMGHHCDRVRGKVNHWFLVVVTRSAAFVCVPFTKGNAGMLSRRYPRIPINPVCGFGCAQHLFEDYMHGERGKAFSHAIARSDRAKRESIIDRLRNTRAFSGPMKEAVVMHGHITGRYSSGAGKWINEDELPKDYPYHEMFPQSKLGEDGLGGVRLFPALAPNPDLATLLESVRNYVMSPEEKEAQRQSWVKGEMALGTDSDEAAYQGLVRIVNHADGCTCTNCQFGLVEEV